MIKFSDIKKKVKAYFSDWDTKIVRKLETWRTRRLMGKIAKLFPTQEARPIKDDDHIIHVDPSRIPTTTGKVLDVKSVEFHNDGLPKAKFWYTSKKEDISGTTEYEIRSNQECQEALSKLIEKQRNRY